MYCVISFATKEIVELQARNTSYQNQTLATPVAEVNARFARSIKKRRTEAAVEWRVNITTALRTLVT